MSLPATIDAEARAIFEAWRYSPGFDGSTLQPQAEFFVDGEVTAVVLFPPFQEQPLAKSLYDVTGTLGMLGDGVVVLLESLMKTYKPEASTADALANYQHGDFAKDPASQQAIIMVKITPEDVDVEVLPFGVDDSGIVFWLDKTELPPEAIGGAMPEVIAQARTNATPLHESIRASMTAVNDAAHALDPDMPPFGQGSVYRGAIAALASMGPYTIAVTESLQEMP